MDAPLSIAGASGVPQCGQNLLPRNATPKHDGQEMVASRAPQYSHCVASDETAPPQFGQFSVPTSMMELYPYRSWHGSASRPAPPRRRSIHLKTTMRSKRLGGRFLKSHWAD